MLEEVKKERDKSELLAHDLAKFQLALDNVSNQVVITDREGIVVYGNPAVEKVTGYTPSEIVGHKAGALWKLPMPTEYYRNMWDVIKNMKQTFKGEIQNRRKNGEVYTAHISISPVLDKNNDILFFVANEHDITREKEIDMEKTEFVSLASHQLKTPVGAMSWDLEMLLNGDYGELTIKQRDVLSGMSVMTKRMNDLINSLLNISRIDMGVFIIEPVPTNFVTVCEEVLTEMEQKIKAKHHHITTVYSKDVENISADPKLLRIIFQNYISNSVKYTHEKGEISVSIEHKDGDVVIRVANNGALIPKNEHHKMFTKLFRASNANDFDPDGYGLGLYIVKKIADNGGGKVWFESEESKGTAFYCSFPLTGMMRKDGTKNLS